MKKGVMRKPIVFLLIVMMILSGMPLTFAEADDVIFHDGQGGPVPMVYQEKIQSLEDIVFAKYENEEGSTDLTIESFEFAGQTVTSTSQLMIGDNDVTVNFEDNNFEVVSRVVRITKDYNYELIATSKKSQMYKENVIVPYAEGAVLCFYYDETGQKSTEGIEYRRVSDQKTPLLESTSNLAVGTYELVAVKDDQILELTLIVENNLPIIRDDEPTLTLAVGASIPVDYAVEATDIEDGNIPVVASAPYTNGFDTSSQKDYFVTYTATDSHMGQATSDRWVHVMDYKDGYYKVNNHQVLSGSIQHPISAKALLAFVKRQLNDELVKEDILPVLKKSSIVDMTVSPSGDFYYLQEKVDKMTSTFTLFKGHDLSEVIVETSDTYRYEFDALGRLWSLKARDSESIQVDLYCNDQLIATFDHMVFDLTFGDYANDIYLLELEDGFSIKHYVLEESLKEVHSVNLEGYLQNYNGLIYGDHKVGYIINNGESTSFDWYTHDLRPLKKIFERNGQEGPFTSQHQKNIELYVLDDSGDEPHYEKLGNSVNLEFGDDDTLVSDLRLYVKSPSGQIVPATNITELGDDALLDIEGSKITAVKRGQTAVQVTQDGVKVDLTVQNHEFRIMQYAKQDTHLNEEGQLAFYGSDENQNRQLIYAYFINSLSEETSKPPYRIMLNGDPLTTTVGLEPGLYEAKANSNPVTDEWLTLEDPGYDFSFEVLNNPPEIDFYGDLLSVILNSQNPFFKLGVYAEDYEGDAFKVILKEDNDLVDGVRIVTDQVVSSTLTYDTLSKGDLDNNNPAIRDLEVIPFIPENGIVALNGHMMVLEDLINNKTTFIDDFRKKDHVVSDLSVNSQGRVSVLMKEFTEENIRYYIADGLPIQEETFSLLPFGDGIVESIAFNSYDDLISLEQYVDIQTEERRLSLSKIHFFDDSNEVGKEIKMHLETLFTNVDIEDVHIQDFAFDQDNNLYILYGIGENPVKSILKVHITRDYTFDANTAEYKTVNVDQFIVNGQTSLGYSGIALYEGQVYLAKDFTQVVQNASFLSTRTILVPLNEDLDQVEIDAYFGQSISLASTIGKSLQAPDKIELEVGYNAVVETARLEAKAYPLILNDSLTFEAEENDIFELNPETGLITALSQGQGVVRVKAGSMTKNVIVEVVEKEIVTDVTELYVEKDGMVTADAGVYFKSPFTSDLFILDESGEEAHYIFARNYIFDASQTGITTYHYKIQYDDKVYYFDRDVRVVESNLNEVSAVLDESLDLMIYKTDVMLPGEGHWQGLEGHNYLAYYNHVSHVTSLIGDVSFLPMFFERDLEAEFDAVAIDTYDNIFLLDDEYLVSINLKTNEMHEWLWADYIEDEAMVQIDNEGLTIDSNNVMYYCDEEDIVTIQLNYDTHTFEIQDIYSRDSDLNMNDLFVTLEGDIYVLSTQKEDLELKVVAPQSYTFTVEKVTLEDGVVKVLDSISLEDVINEKATGLMANSDQLIITADGYNKATALYGVDFELSGIEFLEEDLAQYMSHVTDAASRYTTTLTSDNVTLHIGYNQSVADGQKSLAYEVRPSFRQGLPVTYTLVSGAQVMDLNSETGLVKGKQAGYGKVKITLDGVSTYVDVRVINHSAPRPADPISISVTPDPVEVAYGPGADPEELTEQLRASLSGTSATITWTSADESIARVDENGLVTAVSTGETTITASISGARDSVKVTVFFIDEELDPLGLVEFNLPYVSGYPDQTFRPDTGVTRAELATMFARILKLQIAPTSNRYPDVKNDYWAYGYIDAVTRAGIFSGYQDGTFKPDQMVTRAELSVVIAKYWQYFEVDVIKTPQMISDVRDDFWAKDYIYMIYNAGLVKDFEDGTFRPNEATLRGHIVSILNILIDRPSTQPETSNYTDVPLTHPNIKDIEAASNPSVIKENE